MFDQLKGLGAMAGLMKDLPKLKAQLEEVKQRLAEITVEAESGRAELLRDAMWSSKAGCCAAAGCEGMRRGGGGPG